MAIFRYIFDRNSNSGLNRGVQSPGSGLVYLSLGFLFCFISLYSCSNYKVKEIPPGDVLEKELRAPPEMFREDSREKEVEDGKKTGKKK